MATSLATSRDQGHGFYESKRARCGFSVLRQVVEALGGDGVVAEGRRREAAAVEADVSDEG